MQYEPWNLWRSPEQMFGQVKEFSVDVPWLGVNVEGDAVA